MKRILLVTLLAVAASVSAQQKQLTLESIYEPSKKVALAGAVQSGFEWLDDTTFIWPRRDVKGELVEWRAFDAATGKERPFLERGRLQKALEGAGLGSGEAKEAAGRKEYTFDAKRNLVVIDAAEDLFVFDIDKGTATRLTSAPGEEEVAAFSPDARSVAFVRNNDLFVTDLAGRERRLTNDGNARLLNGKLDWLYQEEIYGRGQWRGFWWSPDSSRIAFLQLDEREVRDFTIVDHIPHPQDVEVYPYPKPGDPNPRAKLFVVPAAGGERTAVDLEKYSGGEFLIVNVAWNGNGSALTYQVQDREQRWLDLDRTAVDGAGAGASVTLFRETTPAWVDPIGNPMFLADGSFLWRSERSGWMHVYHYEANGVLRRQITKGEWEARDLHGVDERGGFVYFSGTERSHIGLDVYRITLDGSGLQRLSQRNGTHTATFNPSLTMYVDRWSDIRTPDQVRVHRAEGTVAHVVDENRGALAGEYRLGTIEFMRVPTRDGFAMEAMMIRPAGFDPKKKYPVFQHLYGGPHAPQVRNAWRTSTLFHHLIAQEGIIVWICDNRTASGKGAVSAWPAYRNLGELELRDVEDGIAFLRTRPYVDSGRVMLNGWSYGGFMVSYALTHSTAFKAGIAGGSVTDWRNYDSVYTERLMQTPEHNPEGYRKSSPKAAAANLHGNLLLLHGTIDDNVHVDNTIQFAYELQKAGRLFELMLYPKSRHGVTAPALQYHMNLTILRFVQRQLLEKERDR